jgi:hypothetical protein
MTASAPPSDQTLRCARHPGTETVLRCGKCETPICPKCLVGTPVGARCPTCAQVKRFAMLIKPVELARAAGLGIGAAAIGTMILSSVPFLGLLGYAILGFLVGEAVSIGANRKRARELGPVAIACLLVGYVVGAAVFILFAIPGRAAALGPSVILAPLLILQAQPILLIGLGIGALLAWMRVR